MITHTRKYSHKQAQQPLLLRHVAFFFGWHVTCCMLHATSNLFKIDDDGQGRHSYMGQRVRNWCFTYFFENDQERKSDFVQPHSQLRGAVWQLERCPSTNKLHIQGYIEYTAPLRMSAVKKHIGDRCHLETRKGTREQAIQYCRKPDTRVEGPWELGSFGGEPGKRTDLHDVAERIQAGDSLSCVVEDFPVQYIKYRRGIEALHARISQASAYKWRSVTCNVYYGDSGAGKTRKAIDEAGGDFYILDQGERVWFDGYESQKTLIIDDFYGWIKYGMLLRILDGHPYRCEIKGGFKWALWTKIIITSNKHPNEWYQQGMTPALKRRIAQIMHFDINFS